MKCPGIIPESSRYETRTEIKVVEPIDLGNGEWTERREIPYPVDVLVIDPAYPCPAEATFLARSMKQVKCELFDQLPNEQDGVHWIIVKDEVFCDRHFVAGTMEHLDGRVTHHAPMSAADARIERVQS